MSDEVYSATDMSTAYVSGIEQGHADMAHIVAERDRLKGMLLAFVNDEMDAIYYESEDGGVCVYCGAPWDEMDGISHYKDCLFITTRKALQEDRDGTYPGKR